MHAALAHPDAVLLWTLAGALLVALAGWVWRRPQRGLLLLVTLLPFDGLLLVLPLPPGAVAWKETLLALTLLAGLQPGRGPAATRRVPGWMSALALFAAAALVTVAWTPTFQAAVGMKVTFFGMLAGVAAWRCPLEARDRDRLVSILAVTGALTAAVGLLQQAMGPSRLHELGYSYNSVIRFTGSFMRSWSTFNSPFPFAFFLMLVVLVTGAAALTDPRRLRNRLVLLAMPLYAAGLAVAVVRTAWVGLVMGIGYLAVTRHRRLLRAAPAVLGVLALLLVVGVAGFFRSASAGDRLSRWEQLPGVVASAPGGVGVGSAGAAAAKAGALSGTSVTFDPQRVGSATHVFQPDDSYLEVLYEDGVAGLALFLVALAALFARARASAAIPGADGDFAAGVAALVAAAAVAAVASSLFEIFPLDYLLWLLAGTVSTLPTATRAPATRPARQAAEVAYA